MLRELFDRIRERLAFRIFEWTWWLLTAPINPILLAALLVVWFAVVTFLIVTIIQS
jgi:hypothetical protein